MFIITLLLSLFLVLFYSYIVIKSYQSELFDYIYKKYLQENSFLEFGIVILVGFTSPIFILIALIYKYLIKK
jgi:hypothetical protein